MKVFYIFLCIALLTNCDSFFFDEKESDSALEVYDAFYENIDGYFSFFEILPNDFDSAYQANRSLLQDPSSSQTLIDALGELVQVLEDGHTDLLTPVISYRGWYTNFPKNHFPKITEEYISNYIRLNNALDYGMLINENIGYIRVKTFTGNLSAENYQEIDSILEAFSEVSGIIIDVRSNGGGNSNNADLISSRFNDEGRLAFRSRQRNSKDDRADFSPWQSKITDTISVSIFSKPTMVLTNRRSFSSTEWFVASMRTIPYVTIVGDTTGGGSGNPKLLDLPNGWLMRVSNTQKELPEGIGYQYEGIYPDIAQWISEADSANGIDTILERAIQEINDQR